jgi:transposase
MKEQRGKSSTSGNRYSEGFKRAVIEEYVRTGRPKNEIQRRYEIKANSAIHRWLKELGYMDPYENNSKLELTTVPEMTKKHKPLPRLTELELRIKLLERRLEDEQLRSEMYKRMIDIAEKQYKIPIRKNSNTK